MKKKTYHVTYREDGKWEGRVEKAERASVVADTKEEAMRETITMAKNANDAQVYIHGMDGKIQEERTYGYDPASTPG